MSNPSRAAREANPGFTETKARHRHGITLHNPATGKCCFETQVGQIYHRLDGQEADSAWEVDSDQNYLKMVKCDFNLRARKLFNAGDLLKWTDPITGQYVTLQPNNLSWVDNVSGSQQFIASPASISAPSVNDDILLWQNGYGSGRHFKYIASTTRLTKHLIIDSLASLPAATVSNPYLELAFVMTPSSGVRLVVDGLAWDKKTTKSTVNAIEFQTSQGTTLWSFSAPTAHDSGESETAGIMQLRKQGGNLIVSVRFPKAWIDQAQFPIMLDPTLDYQIGAGGNDGFALAGLAFNSNNAYSQLGRSNTTLVHNFARFPSVTIPVGATIDSATFSLKIGAYSCSGSPTVDVYAEDAADPAAPNTKEDVVGRTKTAAKLSSWDVAKSDNAWYDADIKNVIEELQASYDYSAGKAVIIICIGNQASGNNLSYPNTQEATGGNQGGKLSITYTEAATAASLLEGNLIRGGLLLHGVLGR